MKRSVLFLFSVLVGCGGSTSSSPQPSPDTGVPDAIEETGVACPPASLPPGVVPTDIGPLEGVDDGKVTAFLGVPFAEPPIGSLRWKAPVKRTCDPAIRKANAYGNACMQPDGANVIGNEDCLTLNVWTPTAKQTNRPVLVFIHGGGNIVGSSGQQDNTLKHSYEGRALAARLGAVVVTVNYRLGAFGFLSHPSITGGGKGTGGNWGLLDQLAALEWVQRNIAAFGGDPKRVMAFGESAGAIDTCALIASPLAKGLFASAALESGICYAQTTANAVSVAQKTIDALSCGKAPDVAACMRAAAADAIVKANPGKVDLAGRNEPGWEPIVDGHVLEDQPLKTIAAGKHQHVPVIVGSNGAETGLAVTTLTEEQYKARVYAYAGSAAAGDLVLAQYPSSDYASPRDAFVALTSDVVFVCSARKTARALVTGQKEGVFRYSFEKAFDNAGPVVKAAGAFHAAELPYVFMRMDANGYVATAAELALSDAMVGYWGRLAKAGDPNGDGAVAWPKYASGGDPYLVLDVPISAKTDLRKKQCDFWDSVLP